MIQAKAEVAVDLFCGIGGFGVGSEAAGVPVVLAVDCWPEVLAVHAANFPECRHKARTLGDQLNGSVEAVAALILASIAAYRYHVHLSPPCQESSVLNTTGDRGEGFRLVQWSLDLIRLLEQSERPPASWSIEQVRTVVRRLPNGTPNVNLNAAAFGVPQSRIRTYAGRGWVAEPASGPPRSILDALPHLGHEIGPYFDSGATHAAMINMDGCGASDSRRARSADAPIDGPALTVRGAPGPPSLRIYDGVRFVKLRSLTLAEVMTLQGFEDHDMTLATASERWVMAGNAVCPPVAEALMRGRLDRSAFLTGWMVKE